MWFNIVFSVSGKYSTDLFTEEAIKVIRYHNKSQPLFLYLAHLAVHSGNPYAPLQAPADIVAKFSYIKDEKRRTFAGKMFVYRQSACLLYFFLWCNFLVDNYRYNWYCLKIVSLHWGAMYICWRIGHEGGAEMYSRLPIKRGLLKDRAHWPMLTELVSQWGVVCLCMIVVLTFIHCCPHS